MARAGLSLPVIVERAAQILDDNGAASLSLAVVAESLGVRTPSLYKHVDGLPGLRRAIMIHAKSNLGLVLGQAAIGRSGEDAIMRVSVAYRRWALGHPLQYATTMHAPQHGDVEDERVSAALAGIIYEILSSFELKSDDAVDATRFLRSALHGFVLLETSGGFGLPVDIERSFLRVVESVVTALKNWSHP